MQHPTNIRDALHNCFADSGGSDDYGRGIIVGLVSGILAYQQNYKHPFRMAVRTIVRTGRDIIEDPRFRKQCIPNCWRDVFEEFLKKSVIGGP